jgi:uncharacterized RDD family membrane protein YckC
MVQPLLFKYQATTIFNAIVLASAVSAISLFLSINLTVFLSEIDDKDGNQLKHTINYKNLLLSLMVCFLSSVFAYYILFFTFGYGQSLVISN